MNTLEVMFDQENFTKVVSILKDALFGTSNSSKKPQMLIIQGSGGNGKTYFMNYLKQSFPSQIFQALSSVLLPSTSIQSLDDFEQREAMIESLKSKRIVWMQMNESKNIDSASFKDLISTNNNTQFVMICNTLPTFGGIEINKLVEVGDAGLFARITVAECSKTSVADVRTSDIKKAIECLCV